MVGLLDPKARPGVIGLHRHHAGGIGLLVADSDCLKTQKEKLKLKLGARKQKKKNIEEQKERIINRDGN